ncbi:hypothetical protein JAAARDRAFT_57031 [Jaapia argillacea MUCL 33604]|uniref:Uncharacterized protein n=1 Tax=Jaapia argillacea MUCL 33604 TaxID=933084 RepID=A0A067PYT6_9AGAM|nr:hypothetical protein JAAARDRAFT_57031 [Jaapia argillacea MUCL 33604]
MHLPPDLCLYLTVPPTRWDIVPTEGEEVEVVPEVEYDLLVEARMKERMGASEMTHMPGSQSL